MNDSNPNEERGENDPQAGETGDGFEEATIPPSEPPTESPTIPPSSPPMEDATIPPSAATEGAPLAPGESPADAPAIGTNIRYFGDYELLEEIARGGMGVVYKARQVTLNRIVALKMILAGQLAGEEDVQRFHAEAEAAAGLDHPGIVPIFEVGEHEGQHYFSMGFVEGSSLSAKVADGPLPPKEAAEYTKKVAEAVAFAHEQGVIHRDLKPANVLLDANDEPRVTDFGLAKKVEGDSGLTATGQILGTPGYMPPEQAAGKLDEVTETADVYSLGAILYNLLTARPPFQADNPLDTLMQVLEQEPVAPQRLNTKVDLDLQTIALKCLEKEPRRRYGSAQELVDELDRFLKGEPILARPISQTARAWRWCKRKPVVAGLCATVAALVLFVAVASPLVAIRQASLRGVAEEREEEARAAQGLAEDRRKQAEEARDQAQQARDQAEQARQALGEEKDKAVRQLYATTISLAYQEWLADNVGRAEQLLDSTPDEFRHWEWDYLKGLCHAELMTLRGRSTLAAQIGFVDGTNRLVSLDRDQVIRVWDLDTGRIAGTYNMKGLGISSNGKWVAAAKPGDMGKVLLVDVTTGETAKILRGHEGQALQADFSADGSRIATVGTDRNVRIWELATGRELASIKQPNEDGMHGITISPSGELVAWKAPSARIAIYDATTGNQLHYFESARMKTA